MPSSAQLSPSGGESPAYEENQTGGIVSTDLSDLEKAEEEKEEKVTRQNGQAGTSSGPEIWQTPPERELFDTGAHDKPGVINRVLSRISTNADWNPGPPPNGGRIAWLMCLCGHFIVMNTWGFINSFGIFQTYYATLFARPPADISWIGSIQVFLTYFIGTFAGRMVDAGFLRPVLAAGTLLTLLGIFATSAATKYWQLLLSQGLCMGLGSGCLFCAAISTVSSYFSTRRSFAIGLVASGSVTGGLVFPAMARQLLPTAGFGWTVRAMGLVQLVTLAFVNYFMKPRLPPRRTGPLVDWAALAELEYTFYAVSMFFNFWGVYFGFYYLAAFARSPAAALGLAGKTLSYEDSLDILLVANAAGLPGRLIPNLLADRFGPLTVAIPVCLACGAALLSWAAVRDPAALYGWAAAYGFASGGIQALFPAGLGSLTAAHPGAQGTRIGMAFTIVSFAVLTGNPLSGALISAMGGRYEGAQAFTGVSLLVGMGFVCAARWVGMRRTGEGWGVRI
ncbi:MFS general substrate transporter [Biscogniauxia marginata]|nr:MFS general substrate transporter [Biscogniauxia marginata]